MDSRLTLFDLPVCVRLKIYALAGLWRPSPINLCPPPNKGSERLQPFHTGLLLVSRAVRDEAYSVLYGWNRFVLRSSLGQRWDSEGHRLVAPLLSIAPACLEHVTWLLVRLNCWPCPLGHNDFICTEKPGHKDEFECAECHSSGALADLELSPSHPNAEPALAACRRLCAHLAEARPSRLNLTFICDISNDGDGEQLARQLVEPLARLPFTLKSCTLRLGRKPDICLAQIAREAAQTLMGRNLYTEKPFPFRGLPLELRLRILQHTALGPPDAAGYDAQYEHLSIRKGRLSKHNNVGSVCCGSCTGTGRDCCCPSTYASFAPTCRCRLVASALSLFLVDRQMYEEGALGLFYPDNLFDFRDDSFASALAFLRARPPDALHRIRRLRFTLTETQCFAWTGTPWLGALERFDDEDLAEFARLLGWASPGRPFVDAAAEWRELLHFVAENMDVPCLSIQVDMRACAWFFVEDSLAYDDDIDGTFRFVYEFFVDVASVMCENLKGIADVNIKTSVWKGLGPWLEREVSGRERDIGVDALSPDVPSYHDLNMRLRGSNYRPDGA